MNNFRIKMFTASSLVTLLLGVCPSYSMQGSKIPIPTNRGQARSAIDQLQGKGDRYSSTILEKYAGIDLSNNLPSARQAIQEYNAAIDGGFQGTSSGLPGGHGTGHGGFHGGDVAEMQRLKAELEGKEKELAELRAKGGDAARIQTLEAEVRRLTAQGGGHGGNGHGAPGGHAVVAAPINPAEEVARQSFEGLKKYLEEEKQPSSKIVLRNFLQPVIEADVKGQWELYQEMYKLVVAELTNANYDAGKQDRIGQILELFDNNPHLKSVDFIAKFISNQPDPLKVLAAEAEAEHKLLPRDFKAVNYAAKPLLILCFVNTAQIPVADGKELAEFIREFGNRNDLLAIFYYFYKVKRVVVAEGGKATGAQLILQQVINKLKDGHFGAAVPKAEKEDNFKRIALKYLVKDPQELQNEILANVDYRNAHRDFSTRHNPITFDLTAIGEHNLIALYYMNLENIIKLQGKEWERITSGMNLLGAEDARAILYHLATIGFFVTEHSTYSPNLLYGFLIDRANPPKPKTAAELEQEAKEKAEREEKRVKEAAEERKRREAHQKAERAKLSEQLRKRPTTVPGAPPPPPPPGVMPPPPPPSGAPTIGTLAPKAAKKPDPGAQGENAGEAAQIRRILEESGGETAAIAAAVEAEVANYSKTNSKKVRADRIMEIIRTKTSLGAKDLVPLEIKIKGALS